MSRINRISFVKDQPNPDIGSSLDVRVRLRSPIGPSVDPLAGTLGQAPGSSSSGACGTPPGGATAYAYDGADNLTQMGSIQQAFNNADGLCWTSGTSGSCASPPSGATTYAYDARGNRITVTPASGGATNLSYDQANRLTAYGSNASYAYNGDGLRMSKTVSGATSQFLWNVGSPVPLLLKDGSTSFVYGPGDLPLEQVNGSSVLFLHHDQVGSTRLVSDSSGASQATYTYDVYGNLTASTGTITNRLRFAGQYWDGESSLYYLRARYYDPSTGQFLSRDPAVATTREPYAYVNDNPLNNVDPLGLLCWQFWDASKCSNALTTSLNESHQWAIQNHEALQELANTADAVAEVSGKISVVCAVAAVATSETGAGLVSFGACAQVSGDLALASQVSGIGLHALAGWGGQQRGYSDAIIDAGGLVIGRLVGAACRGVGAEVEGPSDDWARQWNGLGNAFGERFGGNYAGILRASNQ